MTGFKLSSWWKQMKPYYFHAYKDLWLGLGVITYVYYNLSYGGKKAVKDKPAH